MTDWRAMSQNMPLLSRVLGTAALASVIVFLLMKAEFWLIEIAAPCPF
jgi:hypothetical protein